MLCGAFELDEINSGFTVKRLIVYLTAFDRKKSFSFKKTVEITSHVHFLIHV